MLTDRPFGSLIREEKPTKDLWGILDRHAKPITFDAIRVKLAAGLASLPAPIRLSPAAEYCSIMDGTPFIASCAGSAFPALSARCSRSAAFANGRSKILRPSRWTGKTVALRSI